MATEVAIMWVAVICYVAAGLLSAFGLIWRRPRLLDVMFWPLTVGLLVHGGAVLLRWLRVGHGPYINAYEVMSSSVWVGLTLLVVLTIRLRDIRLAVGPAVALSVLMLGWGLLMSPEVQPLPPTFKGVWLIIHILFAKLAYGSILCAAAFALVFLIRERQWQDSDPTKLRWLDENATRLTALGLVAVTFMIAAGAVWARNAWGRYWAWDPIETWALVTWLAYGLFLHLRITYKIRGRRSAWLVLSLLLISILAFFFIVLVVPTVHTEFMVT